MTAALRLVGRVGIDVTALVGAVAVLLGRVAAAAVRGRVDGRETLRHIERLGLHALPVLFAASFLIGGIVAVQGLNYVDKYNATDVFGWAAGLSSFREVGPLMLGLALAARVGTKNTAELAAQRAYERLDALTALGLDVFRVVVAPRVVALFVFALLAFSLCATTVLVTSFGLAAALGGQRLSASVTSLVTYLPSTHVLSGLFRMGVFGLVLGGTTTVIALDDRLAKTAIGARVFASSVAAIVVIVVVNLILTFAEGA